MKILFGFLIPLIFLISCSEKEELKKEDFQKYSKQGKEVVMESAKTLKGHLMQSIETGGVGYSIGFCNEKALFLMDSLSQSLGVEIRRTSFKIRNPKDNPDEIELKALNTFKNMLDNKEDLHPILKQINENEMGYYFPILIDNPLCLNCHGTVGETIDSTIYSTIKEFYPNDNATGYKLGDLRGIWSVKIPIEE